MLFVRVIRVLGMRENREKIKRERMDLLLH